MVGLSREVLKMTERYKFEKLLMSLAGLYGHTLKPGDIDFYVRNLHWMGFENVNKGLMELCTKPNRGGPIPSVNEIIRETHLAITSNVRDEIIEHAYA